ncbi:endoglucanase 9-like [Macadamia integrifolia]|uniref:endoglucanase 9-like n=1 Tax=Macadamia integrifolia TaxID=60698 RepID=UPI001C4F103D|nr:endoglucanase 9-like [Macadamia integrifolia]
MGAYRASISQILICAFMIIGVSGHPDYREALSKSILFFEGQRSGKLPANQRITWRSDTGLSDGSPENVDLSGGYYDAGDNIKFGLPMAFTTTMLSWSVIEFGTRMPDDELHNAREAIRWSTDYLLKASSRLPDALYVQVGDPTEDHDCWQRPEDIDTPQKVYKVTPTNPGSDVAGETAAALAAASLVFKHVDTQYSKTLLETAKKAFIFADTYKGNYSEHLSSVVCPFYCSYSGYIDELQWGAAWLFKATKKSSYLDYVKSLGVGSDCDTFSWDNKLLGTRVLLSRNSLIEEDEHEDRDEDEDEDVSGFREAAERFICNLLPESPYLATSYTPGGLMYKMNGSNLQYVTSTTFLLTSYAKYMKHSKKTFNCGILEITPTILREHAKKHVDYILGDNPQGMSYMVGFGEKFPQCVHHRGSSLSSLKENPQHFGCKDGFTSYFDGEPNPNILTGAIVGGPDQSDNFADDRDNFAQSEPATYINAPFVGTLAYLAARFN